MGTSASYSGSGSKPAKALRQGISDFLYSQTPVSGTSTQSGTPSSTFSPDILHPALSLFRSSQHRGSNGGSGGGNGKNSGETSDSPSGGGAQRTVKGSATSAGRAAAAAFAFSQGDRETLEKLGLSYDELRQIPNPIDLINRIVDVACESQDASTIEGAEQREVAADIADWVLEQTDKGSIPSSEDIVRKCIGTIISEAVDSEIGAMLREGEWSSENVGKLEDELHEGAEVLAEKADLSPDGVTDEEFANAIEKGIETLKEIIRSKKDD